MNVSQSDRFWLIASLTLHDITPPSGNQYPILDLVRFPPEKYDALTNVWQLLCIFSHETASWGYSQNEEMHQSWEFSLDRFISLVFDPMSKCIVDEKRFNYNLVLFHIHLCLYTNTKPSHLHRCVAECLCNILQFHLQLIWTLEIRN